MSCQEASAQRAAPAWRALPPARAAAAAAGGGGQIEGAREHRAAQRQQAQQHPFSPSWARLTLWLIEIELVSFWIGPSLVGIGLRAVCRIMGRKPTLGLPPEFSFSRTIEFLLGS